MPNENSGNAVRNRTSSARIHSGAPGRGRTPGRPAIASHAASPADIGYASSRTRPEPPQSRHDCLTAPAAARIKVPITKARRERRNFHPCPRHDGHAVPAPPVVPMTIRLRIRAAAPISARYTETGYKLAISHAAPTHGRLTGATMVSAILDGIPRPRPPADAEALAPVLTGHTVDLAALELRPDIRALTTAADDARRQYQACRYSDLVPRLSGLLGRLGAACQLLDGDEQLRAFTLSADAHHVAAGLLLKLDDRGLAAVAADRSMRAALASQDPVTVGASARILTHTLMNGGHLAAAVTTASSHAQRLDHDIMAHTHESLSVYGSLLLRGAIAAAQHDQRDTAYQLLAEADDAAQRLGADGNLRWTAFGPSTLASTGSTSPSPSATRAPPSTSPAASTCAPSP